MKLNELSARVYGEHAESMARGEKKGPIRLKAWRRGRGHGSGNGKTAGRGHKGQKARSGGGVRPGFEGGQTMMFMQLPKRGFNNKRFARKLVSLPVGRLNAFEDGATVDLESLRQSGVLKFSPHGVEGLKILGGGGELERRLTVRATRVTDQARTAIEKAGGTVEEI